MNVLLLYIYTHTHVNKRLILQDKFYLARDRPIDLWPSNGYQLLTERGKLKSKSNAVLLSWTLSREKGFY